MIDDEEDCGFPAIVVFVTVVVVVVLVLRVRSRRVEPVVVEGLVVVAVLGEPNCVVVVVVVDELVVVDVQDVEVQEEEVVVVPEDVVDPGVVPVRGRVVNVTKVVCVGPVGTVEAVEPVEFPAVVDGTGHERRKGLAAMILETAVAVSTVPLVMLRA